MRCKDLLPFGTFSSHFASSQPASVSARTPRRHGGPPICSHGPAVSPTLLGAVGAQPHKHAGAPAAAACANTQLAGHTWWSLRAGACAAAPEPFQPATPTCALPTSRHAPQATVAKLCLPNILAAMRNNIGEVEVVAKGLILLGVLCQASSDFAALLGMLGVVCQGSSCWAWCARQGTVCSPAEHAGSSHANCDAHLRTAACPAPPTCATFILSWAVCGRQRNRGQRVWLRA